MRVKIIDAKTSIHIDFVDKKWNARKAKKKALSEREYTSIGSGQYPVTLGIKKLDQKACWTKITVLLRYRVIAKATGTLN